MLHAVRSTLESAEEAFLCVASVQERGLHLLEKELDALHRRRARARLLVTTTFETTSQSALAMARGFGIDVRVLNPGSGKTFHPKLYLGLQGANAHAVIGSANLTGGLATNLEAAVALRGTRDDIPLTRAWSWAEDLWNDERVQPWTGVAAEPSEEPFEPDLFKALKAEVQHNPVFLTLGPAPKKNEVVVLSPVEIHVETERSRSHTGGAEAVEGSE